MYVIRPDLPDQEADATINKYQAFLLERGAQNLTIKHLGKRRLAYAIKKHREGVYIQMNFQGTPDLIGEMEKNMRISDEIIRFLSLRLEEDIESIPTDPHHPEAGQDEEEPSQ
jgi:small subunit ribosomal protein S6